MSKPQASQLPAAVWRNLRCEWLWVYRGPVPQCSVWSAEIPVPAGVFFVERGEVRIRADGKEICVPRGQAFFSSPHLRRHWFAPHTSLLSVGFRSQWPDGTSLFRNALNFTAATPSLRQATRQLFASIHGPRKTVTYRQAIEATSYSGIEWAAREAAFALWFSVWIETLQQLGVQPAPQARTSRRRVDQLVAWLRPCRLIKQRPVCHPISPLAAVVPSSSCSSSLASGCAPSWNGGGSMSRASASWRIRTRSKKSPSLSAFVTPPISPRGFAVMPACHRLLIA
jgi:hypothetical protein